ncbi:MAG TPA: LamG domain-containing protein, partial [Candidatus Tenderia electrophaga]|nr:LamG domain-containing protein [Candidatus Tenderia electrophaga]
MNKLIHTLLLVLSGLLLVACDNVPLEPGIATDNSALRNYTGPEPASSDVQSFKTNLWDNLLAKCGNCHGSNGQSPTFVRSDDINLAYNDAMTVVNLDTPADSRLVSKVAAGHNCWEASNNACAVIMTAYIENWLGGSGDGLGKQIVLLPPVVKDAGDSKSLPADSSLFASTVYPLLTQYCADCHAESAQIPQAPYFSGSDVDAAYDALKSSYKLDLDTPANSRLVVRLRNEFHNCWDDCQANADELEQAIIDFSNGIALTQVDPQLILSKALTLADGSIASGGSRHEDNVIALYEFKQGSGSTIYDVSGISPALHLQLSGTEGVDYKWVGGWGVDFINSKAQGRTSDSKKLSDFIKASGEYSIEAWVVPANVNQEGPARIISYSAGVNDRNFTLGQTLYNYDFLNRSTTTDANGEPALSSADADEDLQATEQHVVITYDPVNGRSIFVNGVFTDDLDGQQPGNLNDWDETFAFILANEVTNDRPWQGKLRLVAVHNRAMTLS